MMDLARRPWGGALWRGLAVLGMAAAARAQAPAVGYCEAPNPFSGALDCTQFAGGSAAAAAAACAQGVSTPGQAGAFTAGARCPGYAAADFGGECTRTREQDGLAVASVLQVGPAADCATLATVCSTFIRGDWVPAPACSGDDGLEDNDYDVLTAGGVQSSYAQDPATSPGAAEDAALEAAGDGTLPATVEVLADGFQFLEGPVWIPAEGTDPALPPATLLFSDMLQDTIFAWSEADGLSTWTNASFGTNGKALDLDGRLVSFRHGPRDVARGADPADATVLAADFEGRRLNSPNDGAVHPVDGGIWFSDPIWGIFIRDPGGQELDFHGVYRLGTDGNLTLELGGTAMPNGVAISADGSVLFVSDTGGLPIHPNPALAASEPPASVSAWALEDGRVATPDAPLWSRFDYSDGMCVNEHGLWTTRGGMSPAEAGPPGLVLSDPATGEVLGVVPVEDPTNVECNAEGDGVFVTTRDKLVRVTPEIKTE